MSAIDNMGNAIRCALREAPVDEVLSALTGAFVSLTIELIHRNGHDPDKEITIGGGSERDITIHAKKVD